MIASVLILVVSFVLLVYWFRYTCVLLLRSGSSTEHVEHVVAVNHLSFPDVLTRLQGGEMKLDTLQLALQRDYRILHYLLEHSAGLDIPAVERKLLSLDYRVMQLWYRMVRPCSSEHARRALVEMASVLT